MFGACSKLVGVTSHDAAQKNEPCCVPRICSAWGCHANQTISAVGEAAIGAMAGIKALQVLGNIPFLCNRCTAWRSSRNQASASSTHPYSG